MSKSIFTNQMEISGRGKVENGGYTPLRLFREEDLGVTEAPALLQLKRPRARKTGVS